MTSSVSRAHLRIDRLTVAVGGKTVLQDLSLEVPAGEVHALMGPNGAGKSTLAYALAGRDGYEILSGSAHLGAFDLLAHTPEERACAGLFLSFQYPVEAPGLPVLTFLRAALNAQRKARGEKEASGAEFLKLVREEAQRLQISDDMLRRALNVGFSGGEKKRLEALQLAVLSPSFAVLDETDSGLDIDALRIVAGSANNRRGPEFGMLVITHYQRLLDFIRPDRVHVLVAGRIVESGDADLPTRLEREGYDQYLRRA